MRYTIRLPASTNFAYIVFEETEEGERYVMTVREYGLAKRVVDLLNSEEQFNNFIDDLKSGKLTLEEVKKE